MEKNNYFIDEKGFFGKYGGAYVPEILYKCVHDLQEAYLPILESEEFKSEYHQWLRDYVGRPSPLYLARRIWPMVLLILCAPVWLRSSRLR